MNRILTKLLVLGAIPLFFFFTASCALSQQQKVVTASQVNGTWNAKTGTFKIWALGNQKLKVEFDGIYRYNTPDGPMANSGIGSGIATIEGDTAVFKPDGAEDECKITMKFVRGKMIVAQEGICGFGFNVRADGTYRKTSLSANHMFSLSTTASNNCSASGPESSLVAVTLDAPKPSSRRFRRLPSGWDSSISALLSASPVIIETRVSVPLLHVRAFAPVQGATMPSADFCQLFPPPLDDGSS